MKKQIIKGAKPANTSKTSTSNSTSPKTSAKESSTSTTSKKKTADTNPTTKAKKPIVGKAKARDEKKVVEAKPAEVGVQILESPKPENVKSAVRISQIATPYPRIPEYVVFLDQRFQRGDATTDLVIKHYLKKGHSIIIDESTPGKPCLTFIGSSLTVEDYEDCRRWSANAGSWGDDIDMRSLAMSTVVGKAKPDTNAN